MQMYQGHPSFMTFPSFEKGPTLTPEPLCLPKQAKAGCHWDVLPHTPRAVLL